MYKIEFLPIALDDLVEISDYISTKLCNPRAAQNLYEEIIFEIETLSLFPYSAPILILENHLKRKYRKLIVRNYLVFYWVDEDNKTVIISRIVYGRRDIKDSLLID